jgi:tetratricopeptide (TPR) repeat protein
VPQRRTSKPQQPRRTATPSNKEAAKPDSTADSKSTAAKEEQKPKQQAAPRRAAAVNQWALLVGVSKYSGQIQELAFPRKDARTIKEMLVSSAGFAEDHIRLLTDDGAGDAKATKQNILAAIDQYLAPRVQPGHQVMIFLAGHGITRGLGATAKSYFLPVDADAQTKESLEATSIDLEDLGRRLSALKAAQFTIFVDACREDPFPGRGIKGNQMTDVMARGLYIRKSAAQDSDPPTAIIFYACQVGERAYEDPKLEHGVFTYYILSGIRDLASQPDGQVEAGHLASYLRENVKRWTAEYQARAKYPVEQTPTMTATEVRGPMVVVRMAEVAQNLPARPNSGSVSLFTTPRDARLTIDGKASGSAPLQKDLAPGQYTLRAELAGYQPAEAKITVLAGYHQEFTLALKPTASSAAYEKGVQFETERLIPQAIAAYEEAIAQDPNLIVAYEQLAGAYLATSRYRDAVELLTTISEKFPDNPALIARRARALAEWARVEETQDLSTGGKSKKAMKQKDARKEAVRAAELAVQKAPGLAASHIALGHAYGLEERDRQKAISAFVKATTIAPEDAEGYYGIGLTYRLMKQYDQAIPQLNRAIQLRPDYYDAHRELAYCQHGVGNNDKAIRQYNMASSYRGETNNSGEMAGNHLALSALYTEKGQQVGGSEGEAYAQAGRAHESEARELDPTLKIALKVLRDSGLAFRMQQYLPAEVRSLIDDSGVKLPGGTKIPFPRRRP